MKSFHYEAPLESWDPWPFNQARLLANEPWLVYGDIEDMNRRRAIQIELEIMASWRNGWRDVQRRFKLHPVVEKIVSIYRPANWQQLLFEWPHVSISDPERLAYSRDERALEDNRQVITSIGKYIKRHWPSMPDHMIRDYVASHSVDYMKIDTTIEGIICGIELGPRSCMQSGYGSIPFNDDDNDALRSWFQGDLGVEVRWDYHPYYVYGPELGWGMATRFTKDNPALIKGRALIHLKHKCFVRSYCRNPNGDDYNSGSDHTLEAWLKEQGFTHLGVWPEGTLLRYVEHPNDSHDSEYSTFMAPYIDGNQRFVNVTRREGVLVLELDEDGEWKCDNTNGHAFCEDTRESCEDCGAREDSDDMYWVGRREDVHVCSSCFDSYSLVRGQNGWGDGYREYYVHEDDATRVLDNSFRTAYYVDSNDIPGSAVFVDAHDEYFDQDYCVCIDDEWHLEDDCWEDGNGDTHAPDEEFIMFEGAMWPKDDAWQCAGTGLWYPEHEEYITDDNGDTYHPSYTERVSADAETGDEQLIELRAQFEEYVVVHVPMPTQLIPATSMESIELAADLYL